MPEPLLGVMAGLVPAIPMELARSCKLNRDRRDKPGDDPAAVMAVRYKAKGPGLLPGLRISRLLIDQKSIPPPGGMAGIGSFFFGNSATIASVVMSRPATEEAPCSA